MLKCIKCNKEIKNNNFITLREFNETFCYDCIDKLKKEGKNYEKNN